MPVLNGAYGAPKLLWPPERPWSPIVDKLYSGGLDWYRHADGSLSTTQLVYDTARGYRVPTSQVANPTKSLPMAPDEVAEIKKKKSQDQGGKK